MSWQQRRFHGRYDFGRYPLIEARRPQADASDLKAYVKWSLDTQGAMGKCRFFLKNFQIMDL